MDEEQEFLIGKLKAAIDLVYREERPLLQYFVRNEEQEALIEKLRATIQSVCGDDDEFAGDLWSDRTGMEQAFVFRTGLYLSKLLHGTEYESLDLDSEYNKSYGDPKRTRNFPLGVRPDLILHRRNSNSKNKLVAEFKGYWDTAIEKDVLKLTDLTHPEDSYRYTIGILVAIGKKEAMFRYFADGGEIKK